MRTSAHEVAITGNTFPVKNHLKALGGRWSGSQKAWMVPAAVADEARKLVALAGKAPGGGRASRPAKVCKTCGQRINYGVYCGKCEYA